MSNIINVKEERNILSFSGEEFNLVANSTNFYLKFELDSEWDLNPIITVIFNFDGRYEYVELDENRMCQIPPTTSSRIWFCITSEPDEATKLSSTILSLDVEESGDTNLDGVEFYQNTHKNMLGIMQNLLSGNGIKAEFAKTAEVSETQVSLTGDEEISGEKNFVGSILHNSKPVPDCSDISNPNLLINANFRINERGKQEYTREGSDIYTVDRWCLAKGNGSYNFYTRTLTGADESSPTVFCQWIENGEYLVFGKTITASATVNGVRVSKTFEMPETYSEDAIFNVYECDDFVFRLYVSSVYKYLGVQFLVENGKSIVIEEVKVEESSFATKFVDRLFVEDLMLCKRYYQELSTQSAGYAANTERIVFFASSPQSMKKVTVYQMKNNPQVLKNGTRTAVTEVKVQITSDNGLMLYAVGSGFTQFETYFLMGGTIYAEGEIYL